MIEAVSSCAEVVGKTFTDLDVGDCSSSAVVADSL